MISHFLIIIPLQASLNTADNYPHVWLWFVINFIQTALWVGRHSVQKVYCLTCLRVQRLHRFFLSTMHFSLASWLASTLPLPLLCADFLSHKCHLLHRLELLLFQTVWILCNKQCIGIFTSVSVPLVQSCSYSGTFKVSRWTASIISLPEDKVFCSYLWIWGYWKLDLRIIEHSYFLPSHKFLTLECAVSYG